MGEFEKIVAQLWPVEDDASDAARNNAKQRTATLRYLIRDADTQKAIKGTRWAGYQAVTEYLADTLNKIGFKAKPRIVDGEVYFQTIGNQKTKAQAGFANWFQDFPHPGNFLFLVDPDTIQETNNQNFSNVDDPEIKKQLDELDKQELSEAAAGYAELDKKLVENADVIPYGHRRLPSFYSERIAADQVLFHPVMLADYTSFALKK